MHAPIILLLRHNILYYASLNPSVSLALSPFFFRSTAQTKVIETHNGRNKEWNEFTHFCSLRLDIGESLRTGPLLCRSWHPLQPLRGRGRGGWGSRPLAWFATRQDDGRILLSSRLNHYSSFTFFCANNFRWILRRLYSRAFIIADEI